METEALRRMSAAEKLAVMTSLIRKACRLKGAWIRLNHPEFSKEELRTRVLEAMAGDREGIGIGPSPSGCFGDAGNQQGED